MSERSNRVQRVERELFVTLSEFLVHGLAVELPCFVSITAVEVNPNLRHAKVFFRIVGEAAVAAEAKEILQGERHQFQREVARTLKTKFCPVLRFEFGVVGKSDPIDDMLEKLKRPAPGWGD